MTSSSNDAIGAYLANNGSGTGAISVISSTFSSNTIGSGLDAYSKGAITLNKVTANYNSQFGAYLVNNFSGATGAISVSSSTFNGSTGLNGLDAYSKGAITLTTVTASSNDAIGAYLANNGSGATGAISVSSSTFNGSTTGDGLDATSNGAITLTTVTASYNHVRGAELENGGMGDTGAISVGSSTFNGNTIGRGLLADSNGAITLNKVTASSNGYGALLENNFSGATGAISVTSSIFSSNTTVDGLDAYSNGAITLNKVIASSNHGTGVLLENDGSGATGAISVSSSTFNSNTLGDGLDANSNGAITLNKVTANDNGISGASLDNHLGTGAISVSSSTLNYSTTGPGLAAESNGAITLNKVTASYNHGDGASLHNDYSGATGAISVSSSTFGSSTAGDGLLATSYGTITLTTVTANSNFAYGAYLTNNSTGATYNVSISKSNFNSNITSLNGQEAGLYIYTNGNVSLLSISASNNLGGDGTDVYGGTSTSLMVSNSTFNNNDSTQINWGEGLYSDVGGSVTLSKVTANFNHSEGAYITGSNGAVSVSSSTFNGATAASYNDGLEVSTKGTIMLNKVTANVNNGYGAELYNNLTGATGAITVSSSTFNNSKTESGLDAASNGAITLSKVTATANISDGVYVTSNTVLVSSSNISHNDAYGIYATLFGGTLTLNHVTLTGNTSGPCFVNGLGTVIPSSSCP